MTKTKIKLPITVEDGNIECIKSNVPDSDFEIVVANIDNARIDRDIVDFTEWRDALGLRQVKLPHEIFQNNFYYIDSCDE